MDKLTETDISKKIRSLGFAGRVVGVHSQISALGPVDEAPLTPDETRQGVKPFAKTVLNGLLDGLGGSGTLFVPTHSLCTPGKNEYYRPETSPSTTGQFTETVRLHPRAVRSRHPTHSTASIGAEAAYLAAGHTPFTPPMGLESAFAKVIGLDGFILFIGQVLRSNTLFHALETLVFPQLAPYFPGVAAAEYDGIKRFFAIPWFPYFHRNFYEEHKGPTRAFNRIREAGLLFEDRLGNAPIFFFKAKDVAKYFAETVFPEEPDILFCSTPDTCDETQDCAVLRIILKRFYANASGQWDPDKIRKGMAPEFLALLRPGIHRVAI